MEEHRKKLVVSVLALAAISVMYTTSMSAIPVKKEIITINIPLQDLTGDQTVPVNQTAAVSLTAAASQVAVLAVSENNTLKPVSVAAPAETVAPSQPAESAASIEFSKITPKSITLNWGTIAEGPVAGYKIFRDGEFLANVTDGQTFTNTSGIKAGSTYTYQISAYDISGDILGKSEVAAITIPE